MKTQESTNDLTIGVLALQGAFQEHLNSLAKLGLTGIPVRNAKQLEICEGLIIPGGESTAIRLALQNAGLLDPLARFIRSHPVWVPSLLFHSWKLTHMTGNMCWHDPAAIR